MKTSLTLYATFSALDKLYTVDGEEYPKEVVDIISNLAKDGWKICRDGRGDRAGIIHLVLTFTLDQ